MNNQNEFVKTKLPEIKNIIIVASYFLFGQGGGETLSKSFELPLLARIPIDENICASCDEGMLHELFNNKAVKYGFDDLLKGIVNGKEAVAR